MPGSIIAIIFDFDDTVADDTTDLFLKEKLEMNKKQIQEFWNKDVRDKVKEGWDPPLAYINLILEHIRNSGLKIKNQDLRQLGNKVKLYPGVEDMFSRLRVFVHSKQKLQKAHVQLEFYIISGGFEEIIRGTPISKEMKDIFGCTFDEENGKLIPKSIITFTEKTKFLYAINKGLSGFELRSNPYSVNDVISETSRRIPFKNMIYLGDGPTDIPCFSTIQKFGGKTIGILKYRKRDSDRVDKRRAWAFAKGDRITLGPYRPVYTEESDLYENLKLQVERVGLDIYDAHMRRE
mgnify:CR=1 FL=1